MGLKPFFDITVLYSGTVFVTVKLSLANGNILLFFNVATKKERIIFCRQTYMIGDYDWSWYAYTNSLGHRIVNC